jgi:hypothetical protein
MENQIKQDGGNVTDQQASPVAEQQQSNTRELTGPRPDKNVEAPDMVFCMASDPRKGKQFIEELEQNSSKSDASEQ